MQTPLDVAIADLIRHDDLGAEELHALLAGALQVVPAEPSVDELITTQCPQLEVQV